MESSLQIKVKGMKNEKFNQALGIIPTPQFQYKIQLTTMVKEK